MVKYINDNAHALDKLNECGYLNSEGGLCGKVIIKDPITGEILSEEENKVVVAGAVFTASKHFGVVPPITLPSYNTALSLENSVNSAAENPEKIYLFAVGVGGCGAEASQIYDVDYKSWITPENLVPLRYGTTDISSAERQKYFGRKVASGRYAYYFKAFESEPTMHIIYADGTEVEGASIYSAVNNQDIKVYVETSFKITPEDCREFFQASNNLENAKINTISLLQAWRKTVNGNVYYQNIQPVTKYNISNEALYNVNKGLDFVYRLFY